MIRVRAGLRVSLPFGLFPNCATFVFKVADLATVNDLHNKVELVKAALYALKQKPATELADRLFLEASA